MSATWKSTMMVYGLDGNDGSNGPLRWFGSRGQRIHGGALDVMNEVIHWNMSCLRATKRPEGREGCWNSAEIECIRLSLKCGLKASCDCFKLSCNSPAFIGYSLYSVHARPREKVRFSFGFAMILAVSLIWLPDHIRISKRSFNWRGAMREATDVHGCAWFAIPAVWISRWEICQFSIQNCNFRA